MSLKEELIVIMVLASIFKHASHEVLDKKKWGSSLVSTYLWINAETT